MEIVTKIFTIIGSVAVVVGLSWALLGYISFSQAKKNNDSVKMDQAIESMVFGGVLAATTAGIVAVIINTLNSITF